MDLVPFVSLYQCLKSQSLRYHLVVGTNVPTHGIGCYHQDQREKQREEERKRSGRGGLMEGEGSSIEGRRDGGEGEREGGGGRGGSDDTYKEVMTADSDVAG